MISTRKWTTLRGAVCALVLLSASPALAVTATPFAGGDDAFNGVCAGGNGAGTGNQKCEFAAGELRIGGSNTWEVGIQSPPGHPVSTRDVVWGNATPTAFTFGFDGTELSLTTGGVTSTATISDLGGVQSMFIRTRGLQKDTVTLSGMTLNGHAIPDLAPRGAGGGNAGYLQVSGIDWSANWTLAGLATFSWAGNMPNQSNLNVTFKLTDVAPIPLPAAGLLLLGALGGLGAMARRKRAAAAA